MADLTIVADDSLVELTEKMQKTFGKKNFEEVLLLAISLLRTAKQARDQGKGLAIADQNYNVLFRIALPDSQGQFTD